MEQIKQGNHSLPPNLLTILRKLGKTFTEKSDPVFLDENAKKLTLKEIHNKECVGDKPITMIAVSRHQYDVANFPKYINYIKKYIEKKYNLLWIISRWQESRVGCIVYHTY